jgi:hypothetical protein
MSAHSSKQPPTSGVSRKNRRQRNRNGTKNANALMGLRFSPTNPNTTYEADLRIGEWTIFLDGSGTFQTASAPGAAPSQPFRETAPSADSYPNTLFVSFSTNILPSSFNSELFNAFQFYQIKAVKCQFESLMAESWNVIGAASAPATQPEILFAVDPSAYSPLATPSLWESYVDTRRQVLSAGKNMTVVAAVRPQVVLEAGTSPSPSTAAAPSSSKELWFYTQGGTIHVGPVWCVRNWFSSGGVNSPAIRVSMTGKVLFKVPF